MPRRWSTTRPGIFLTGGNQLRLSSVVGGDGDRRAPSPRARDRGVVVAGTSAGASAVSPHMMAFGASGATPKHRMAQIVRGLGLLDDLVVDQHFEQRTRLGRLLAVVAQSPSLLGLGLDEDTAAIVDARPHARGHRPGRGDHRRRLERRDRRLPDQGAPPMMVSGAVLHSLPSGYRFDLETRSLLPRLTEAGERARRPKRRLRRWPKLARTMAAEGADSFVIDRRHERERRLRGARSASSSWGARWTARPPSEPPGAREVAVAERRRSAGPRPRERARPSGRRATASPPAAARPPDPRDAGLPRARTTGPTTRPSACWSTSARSSTGRRTRSRASPSGSSRCSPACTDHSCSLGRPGGFVERLKEGTWLGHVAEHVALELQRETGTPHLPGQDAERRQAGPVQRHLRLRRGAGRPGGRAARGSAGQPPGRGRGRSSTSWSSSRTLIRLAERARLRAVDPGDHRRGRRPRHPLDPAERGVARPAGAGQVPAADPGHDDVDARAPWPWTSPATRSSPRSCWPRPGCPCRAARSCGPRTRRSRRPAGSAIPVVTKPIDGNHGRGVGLDLRDDERRPAGLRAGAGRGAPAAWWSSRAT